MKKMMHKQILPILLGSLCFLSGCNSSPATNDIPDDTAQNAVMSESETFPTQQDSKEEISEATEEILEISEEAETVSDEAPWEKYVWLDSVSVTELAPEEITSNYQSFNFLCGMSIDEVQTALGCELTFVEEFGDSTIYTDSNHTEYHFLTVPDALYCIYYKNLEADAALQLAQSYYEEIYALYGENYVYPVQWEIHKIKSIDELDNNKFKETYSERWPVLYNSRMDEKVREFLSTDKVKLSLSLDTPIYQNQGYYAVGISQTSGSLDSESSGN